MNSIIIKIELGSNLCECLKSIGFISEDIVNYRVCDNNLIVDLSDNANVDKIKDSISNYIKSFRSFPNKKLFQNNIEKKSYYDVNNFSGVIKKINEGEYILNGVGVFLFTFFDAMFEKVALKHNAVRKIYPVLLPLNSYVKTGYLKRSPQYAMFCCNTFEDLDLITNLDSAAENNILLSYLNEPQFALSPSACFHTYLEYENSVLENNSIITFCQSVFRNEGRFNFSEIGRLRDYHVREIVIIGDEKYVTECRKSILKSIIELIKEINLVADISVASDPFILPEFQKFKKVQLYEEAKYEVNIYCSKNKKISAASLNLHGTAFSYPFNIKVKNDVDTVTGCVGFGIERWVIAFISQYGIDYENWPDFIRNQYVRSLENE